MGSNHGKKMTTTKLVETTDTTVKNHQRNVICVDQDTTAQTIVSKWKMRRNYSKTANQELKS
jgi:hypothetical protein